MVGPSKQFDQQEALSKALNVFWNKGYEATSMQDLVASMGINRASMYQTYGNKHALFVLSLDLYIRMSLSNIQKMTDTFVSESDSSFDSLQRVFETMIETGYKGEQNGCFINNTAIELASHDPDIAKKIRQFWIDFENIFTTHIQHAIDNNEIDADTNAKQISSLLNINLQGLMVKSKTSVTKDELLALVQSLFDLVRHRTT
ncbi:Transcriptional regulator, AcrR family [hydrothermal vent metagenome]|uniref:Transcriptional regulator, AcrR family n=1 Tax=hydrothermal vent metagenome TaxID=652676 RepID=A0A3B1B3D7_9ZZZZ